MYIIHASIKLSNNFTVERRSKYSFTGPNPKNTSTFVDAMCIYTEAFYCSTTIVILDTVFDYALGTGMKLSPGIFELFSKYVCYASFLYKKHISKKIFKSF